VSNWRSGLTRWADTRMTRAGDAGRSPAGTGREYAHGAGCRDTDTVPRTGRSVAWANHPAGARSPVSLPAGVPPDAVSYRLLP
jgi:hypothetical protein